MPDVPEIYLLKDRPSGTYNDGLTEVFDELKERWRGRVGFHRRENGQEHAIRLEVEGTAVALMKPPLDVSFVEANLLAYSDVESPESDPQDDGGHGPSTETTHTEHGTAAEVTDGLLVPEPGTVEPPPRCTLAFTDFEEVERLGSTDRWTVSLVQLPRDEPVDRVAVKTHTSDRTISREDVVKFERRHEMWQTLDDEARSSSHPGSDHVLGFVDTGDDIPWVAMEHADGGSLAARLRGAPAGLPISEALWLGERVCEGLAFAHNHGVAHLDVKPENVLLRETGTDDWNVPKLADWESAVQTEAVTASETLSMQYAAPEQVDPEQYGTPGTQTDVYQAAGLVYELLTGDPPFDATGMRVVSDSIDDLPRPPSRVRPELSEETDDVLFEAFSPRQRDRYDSAGQLARALERRRTDRRAEPR